MYSKFTLAIVACACVAFLLAGTWAVAGGCPLRPSSGGCSVVKPTTEEPPAACTAGKCVCCKCDPCRCEKCDCCQCNPCTCS